MSWRACDRGGDRAEPPGRAASRCARRARRSRRRRSRFRATRPSRRGGRRRRERIAVGATAAERAASSGAHREAAAQYARALRFADGLSLDRRAELLQRRADECYMTDQFDEAIEAQEAALECHRQLGDQRGEGDSLRSLSRFCATSAGLREAERWRSRLSSCSSGCRRGTSSQLPTATSRICAWHGGRCGGCDVGQSCARARTTTRRHGGARLRPTNIGAVDFRAGETEGRVKLERALALAQRHGLEDHAGRVFFNLVVWPVRHRMFALAYGHLEAGLEYCSERGLDTWRLYLLACRARLELDPGRWERGGRLGRPGPARSSQCARSPRLGIGRARTASERGAATRTHRRRSTRQPLLAEPTRELQRIAPVAAARAEAAWLAGDHATVAQVTDAALALALDRQGRGSSASSPTGAGGPGSATSSPTALCGAVPPLDRRRVGTSRAAVAQDRLSIRGGTRAGGRRRRRRAPALRRATGAGRPAGRCDRRAAAARARRARPATRAPRPRTRANPAGLTARELEVLALLVEACATRRSPSVWSSREDGRSSCLGDPAQARRSQPREAGARSRSARAGTSKIGTASSQYGESSRCARARALVGSCSAESQRSGDLRASIHRAAHLSRRAAAPGRQRRRGHLPQGRRTKRGRGRDLAALVRER